MSAHLHYCPICDSVVGVVTDQECKATDDHEALDPCGECLKQHIEELEAE
jgi:hypothetical protein